MPVRADPQLQRKELAAQRRRVDFDTYDVTVDEILRRTARGRIEIAPVYQRQFRWDTARQSSLVESVLLGIPVPPLFMATNAADDVTTQWEVVDGLQRLLSLVNFCGDEKARTVSALSSDAPLRLEKLEKLDSFNNCTFEELPDDIRSALEDRPLKVVVLNDKSDLQVRFDLFERLNTGGVRLTDQEIRECVYRGPFIDLLVDLSDLDSFQTVVRLPERSWKDGTPQEFALRFFAFLESRSEFKHSVVGFLNDFTGIASEQPNLDVRRQEFVETFAFLAKCIPGGLKTRKGQTPVNMFEAVSVGAALALREQTLSPEQVDMEWLSSTEFRQHVTGATNSRRRVAERIEYARDRFLGIDA